MTHKSTVAGVAGFRRLVRLKARPGASTALPFRSTFTMVMPRPQQCRPYALISGILTGRRMRAHASSRFGSNDSGNQRYRAMAACAETANKQPSWMWRCREKSHRCTQLWSGAHSGAGMRSNCHLAEGRLPPPCRAVRCSFGNRPSPHSEGECYNFCERELSGN